MVKSMVYVATGGNCNYMFRYVSAAFIPLVGPAAILCCSVFQQMQMQILFDKFYRRSKNSFEKSIQYVNTHTHTKVILKNAGR